MNELKKLIRSFLHGLGYDLVKKKPSKSDQLSKFLNATNITHVFDVGANIGQFASDLRKSGYMNNIFSFEPLEKQFTTLSSRAENDLNWTCYNFAFGDVAGTKNINIANNNHSSASSFLELSELSADMIDVKMTETAKVEIRTLKEFLETSDLIPNGNTLLKLDVQGFEHSVMKGAGVLLSRFPAILLEASFFSLYKDEKLVGDLIHTLKDKGYVLAAFFVEMESDIGTTLQSDILFVSQELYKKLEPLHRQPNQ